MTNIKRGRTQVTVLAWRVLRARVADANARLPERASEWVEVIA